VRTGTANPGHDHATDFKGGANESFLARTMTPAEVGARGIPGAEGGLQGLSLQSGGKLYTFALRPLLPDETNQAIYQPVSSLRLD